MGVVDSRSGDELSAVSSLRLPRTSPALERSVPVTDVGVRGGATCGCGAVCALPRAAAGVGTASTPFEVEATVGFEEGAVVTTAGLASEAAIAPGRPTGAFGGAATANRPASATKSADAVAGRMTAGAIGAVTAEDCPSAGASAPAVPTFAESERTEFTESPGRTDESALPVRTSFEAIGSFTGADGGGRTVFAASRTTSSVLAGASAGSVEASAVEPSAVDNFLPLLSPVRVFDVCARLAGAVSLVVSPASANNPVFPMSSYVACPR